MLDIKTYGALALALLFLEITRIAASQWIGGTLLRITSTISANEKEALLGTGLSLTLGLTIVGAAILTPAIIQYEILTGADCTALIALLIVKSVYLHSLDLCRLNERANTLSAASLTQAILSISFTATLLTQDPTVFNALIALCASYAFPILLTVKLFNFSFKKEAQKKILTYGFPILISGTLATLGSKIDKIVISNFINLEAVGFYAALSNLSLGVISIVFLLISAPLYPELAKVASQEKDLEKAHSAYLSILIAVVAPSTLGLCLISDDFLSLFLPSRYTQNSQHIFLILTAAAFFYNLKGHYVDHAFQFLLKTTYLPWISLLTVTLSTTFTIILIPYMGIVGAAYAWLATTVTSIFVSYFWARRLKYYYRPHIDIVKILISCFIMSLALYYGGGALQLGTTLSNLSAKVLLGGVAYATLLVLLNTFNIRTKLFNRQTNNEI